MQKVTISRGLDIPISGEAQRVVSEVGGLTSYVIDPSQFVGIVPKMLVKEGDIVKKGSPLFRDKTFDAVVCTSPVSGVISRIERGECRKVLAIHVEKDDTDAVISFKEDIAAVSDADDVLSLLQKSGYWVYIKQRPYACVAMPDKKPSAVFVSTFDSAPLAPDYAFVLHGQNAYIQQAIHFFSKIAPVYIGFRNGDAGLEFSNLTGCSLYQVDGPHPAGNVGVQINHVRPMGKGETIWTINIYDLALIGKFLSSGVVNFDRTVALTGPMVYAPQYYKITPGGRIREITSCNLHKGGGLRIIEGNPISGTEVSEETGVGYALNQITVISDGADNHEFMGWMMPRFSSFNAHRTDPAAVFDNPLFRYLFGKKHYDWDARLKGGRRPLIVSNEYDKVFPMDIYPEQLIKAMLAGNIDKMEQLGVYEVAPEDFALCEYVCTSKLPLQAIVRQALDNVKKEVE